MPIFSEMFITGQKGRHGPAMLAPETRIRATPLLAILLARTAWIGAKASRGVEVRGTSSRGECSRPAGDSTFAPRRLGSRRRPCRRTSAEHVPWFCRLDLHFT